jgi:predicted DNA-binding transcriptional regulator AlpA
MPPNDEFGSFTLQQWCKRHGISRAMFYILKKDDCAPRTFNIGRSVRVSIDADKDWVLAREAAALN